jgi:hypothetical protein
MSSNLAFVGLLQPFSVAFYLKVLVAPKEIIGLLVDKGIDGSVCGNWETLPGEEAIDTFDKLLDHIPMSGMGIHTGVDGSVLTSLGEARAEAVAARGSGLLTLSSLLARATLQGTLGFLDEIAHDGICIGCL